MKKLLCLFSFLFLSVATVFAQDIHVRAEVNIRKVVLDSFIQLTITVEGTQDAAPPQVPTIEGFQVRYLGPSRRTSIFNGRYTTSIAFSYSLFPLETGKFTIPAITVTVEGQDYTTQPIDVEVLDDSLAANLPSTEGRAPVGLEDKIFLSLKVPKTDVYLNEKLPVKVMLFVTDLSVRDIQYPQLENVGLRVEDYADARQSSQVIQGVRFNIIEFDTTIYPTRVGSITLGPARVECNLLVRSPQAGMRSGFFSDDFFDSFFNRHEKRPMTITSNTITLNVQPLPEEGQPKEFTGAVGSFDFQVTVSPTQVKVGDPITLRMIVSGDGNLSAVQFPEFRDVKNFKKYDPVIKEEKGRKILEQVIIPKSDDIQAVQAIHFSYFDVDKGGYRTITQGPFPIVVTPLDRQERLRVVGAIENDLEHQEESLGEDIIFIKESPGAFRSVGKYFYQSIFFYLLLFLLMGGFIGGYVAYQKKNRLRTDIKYARRMRAPKEAKKGLQAARNLMQAQKSREFYDLIFKTLQQYLGNKLHLSSGAITYDVVASRLTDVKYQKVLSAIKNIFDKCDTVRYAAVRIDQKEMAGTYNMLQQIIDYLEEHL